jgi:hypothetical protein
LIVDFGQALQLAKDGNKIARVGWNGSGMYAVLMGGFPNGVPANAGTAEIHNIPVGTLVKVRPYWALRTAQGDIATWAPSGSDVLAEDWVLANDKEF